MFTIVYHRLPSPLRGAGNYVERLNAIKIECIDSASEAKYLKAEKELKKMKDEEESFKKGK